MYVRKTHMLSGQKITWRKKLSLIVDCKDDEEEGSRLHAWLANSTFSCLAFD